MKIETLIRAPVGFVNTPLEYMPRLTREISRRVAGSSASIMLDGENGTGKELFAQAIHNASPRPSSSGCSRSGR